MCAVQKLQLVLNAAARVLTGTPSSAHFKPVLKELHWLPVSYRAMYKVVLLSYKALNNLGPGYLADHLPLYTQATFTIFRGGPARHPNTECLHEEPDGGPSL